MLLECMPKIKPGELFPFSMLTEQKKFQPLPGWKIIKLFP